jgi:hypothetical protein
MFTCTKVSIENSGMLCSMDEYEHSPTGKCPSFPDLGTGKGTGKFG